MFGLPVARSAAGGQKPELLSVELYAYRLKFMKEELAEFMTADGEKDLAGMADALVDLVWVALGTAHYLGIPFDHVWEEVRRANMAKRRWRDGDPVKPRAEHLKNMGPEIVKPLGWQPPDIDAVLDREASFYGEKI